MVMILLGQGGNNNDDNDDNNDDDADADKDDIDDNADDNDNDVDNKKLPFEEEAECPGRSVKVVRIKVGDYDNEDNDDNDDSDDSDNDDDSDDDIDDEKNLPNEEEGERVGCSVKVHCCLSFKLMKIMMMSRVQSSWSSLKVIAWFILYYKSPKFLLSWLVENCPMTIDMVLYGYYGIVWYGIGFDNLIIIKYLSLCFKS